MVQVAGEFCELRARALLLAFDFRADYLLVVFVQVASHLVIFRLHVLEVLLTCVEVMLPAAAVVSSVAVMNKNLSVK